MCYQRRVKTPKRPAPPNEPPPETYARPTPKVSRLKRGKVFSAAEREAFLKSRGDLTKKPT